MSPNPRPRMRYDADDPERRLRIRLDLLIALMAVQIVLSIGLWVDRYRAREVPSNTPTVAESRHVIEQPAPTVSSTQVYTEPAQDLVTQPDQTSEQTLPIKIKVQVLNGSGVPGIAKRARDWLSRQDYEIRDVGNADRQDYRVTRILNRSGNLTTAREMARILGVEESNISRQSSPAGLDVDLTLIIGRDYKRFPFAR